MVSSLFMLCSTMNPLTKLTSGPPELPHCESNRASDLLLTRCESRTKMVKTDQTKTGNAYWHGWRRRFGCSPCPSPLSPAPVRRWGCPWWWSSAGRKGFPPPPQTHRDAHVRGQAETERRQGTLQQVTPRRKTISWVNGTGTQACPCFNY